MSVQQPPPAAAVVGPSGSGSLPLHPAPHGSGGNVDLVSHVVAVKDVTSDYNDFDWAAMDVVMGQTQQQQVQQLPQQQPPQQQIPHPQHNYSARPPHPHPSQQQHPPHPHPPQNHANNANIQGFWARAAAHNNNTQAAALAPAGASQQPSQQQYDAAHIKMLRNRLDTAERKNKEMERRLASNTTSSMPMTQQQQARPYQQTHQPQQQHYAATLQAQLSTTKQELDKAQRERAFENEELVQLREQAREREAALANWRRRARELEEERVALSRSAAAAATAAATAPPPQPPPPQVQPQQQPHHQQQTSIQSVLLKEEAPSLYWLASLSPQDARAIAGGTEASTAARAFLDNNSGNNSDTKHLCTSLSRLVAQSSTSKNEPSLIHGLRTLASLLEHDRQTRATALAISSDERSTTTTTPSSSQPPRFPASSRVRVHGAAPRTTQEPARQRSSSSSSSSQQQQQPVETLVLVNGLCRLLKLDASGDVLVPVLRSLHALLLETTCCGDGAKHDAIAMRVLGVDNTQEENKSVLDDGLPRLFEQWAADLPSSCSPELIVQAVDLLRLVLVTSPAALAWERNALEHLPHFLPPPPRTDERARNKVPAVEPHGARKAIPVLLSQAAVAECFAALLRFGERGCVDKLVFACRPRGEANRYGLVSRLAQLAQQLAHAATVAVHRCAALGARGIACGGAWGGVDGGGKCAWVLGGAYEDAAAVYDTMAPGAARATAAAANATAEPPALLADAPLHIAAREAAATCGVEASALVGALEASLALIRALVCGGTEVAFDDLMSTNEGHRCALEACALAQRLGNNTTADDDDMWRDSTPAEEGVAAALVRLAPADLRGGEVDGTAAVAAIAASLERRIEDGIQG